jgi:hypothetical protein
LAPQRGDRVGDPAPSRGPQTHGPQALFSPNFQAPKLSYTRLLLDREYMIGEMLPALAEQHFRKTGDGFDYQLAVVRSTGQGVVYHTTGGFSPGPGAVVDAAVDLFQVRTQDFGAIAAEVRRFVATFTPGITAHAPPGTATRGFALRPVAVAAMLREIVESSRALIDAAGVQVEYDLPDGLPPVLGDEPALRRVFQNLVANAVKYGAPGGPASSERTGARVERWIGLRARRVGREVHVTVADRGIGIAAAEQPRIFEPFYRTPDVVAAQIQGAGLGLSLVKRIVDAHAGRIMVRSARERAVSSPLPCLPPPKSPLAGPP